MKKIYIISVLATSLYSPKQKRQKHVQNKTNVQECAEDLKTNGQKYVEATRLKQKQEKQNRKLISSLINKEQEAR